MEVSVLYSIANVVADFRLGGLWSHEWVGKDLGGIKNLAVVFLELVHKLELSVSCL